MENNNQIIRDFDSTISQKASKVAFQELQTFCYDNFAKNTDGKATLDKAFEEIHILRGNINK